MIAERHIRLGLLLSVLAAFPAANAEAQQSVQLEASPFVGGAFFLSDPPSSFMIERQEASPLIVQNGEFRNAVAMGVTAGLRIRDNFGLEATFSWLPTELTAPSGLAEQGGNVNVNTFTYGANFLYHFTDMPTLEPFLGLGIGAETTSYDPTLAWERRTQASALFIAGGNLWLSDRLALRLEARNRLKQFSSDVTGVDDIASNNLMITAGLNFITTPR